MVTNRIKYWTTNETWNPLLVEANNKDIHCPATNIPIQFFFSIEVIYVLYFPKVAIVNPPLLKGTLVVIIYDKSMHVQKIYMHIIWI